MEKMDVGIFAYQIPTICFKTEMVILMRKVVFKMSKFVDFMAYSLYILL